MHDLATTVDHHTDLGGWSDAKLAAIGVRLDQAAAAVRAIPNPTSDDQDLIWFAAKVRIELRRRTARRVIAGAAA